jgi:hypothetical protein
VTLQFGHPWMRILFGPVRSSHVTRVSDFWEVPFYNIDTSKLNLSDTARKFRAANMPVMNSLHMKLRHWFSNCTRIPGATHEFGRPLHRLAKFALTSHFEPSCL